MCEAETEIMAQLSDTAEQGLQIAKSRPGYPHGENPLMCDPYRGRYCSVCGCDATLAYVIRKIGTRRPTEALLTNMRAMVSKWKGERWHGWQSTVKEIDPMLQYLIEARAI